jgi:hypothetical protein
MKAIYTGMLAVLAIVGTFVSVLAITAPPKEQVIYIREAQPVASPEEQAAFAAKQEAERQARIEAELKIAAAIDLQAQEARAKLEGEGENETPKRARRYPTDFEFEMHDARRDLRQREEKLDREIRDNNERLDKAMARIEENLADD